MITMQYFMEDIKDMTPEQAYDFITSFYNDITYRTGDLASDKHILEEEYEFSLETDWDFYNLWQYEDEYLSKEAQIEECWRIHDTLENKEIEDGLTSLMEDIAEIEAAYNFVMCNKPIDYRGLNVIKVTKYITIYRHDLNCIHNNEMSTLSE